MGIIDLTREFVSENVEPEMGLEERFLQHGEMEYTGMIWHHRCDTMTGSYLDFPGHIKECDDGARADNVNIGDYYRIPATVIHLNRADVPGAVTAEDLRAANGGDRTREFLIINALGEKNPHDVAWRSIYLDRSAAEWIIKSGCRLVISDIYESENLIGIFYFLFKAGISAVCEPVNLAQLGSNPLVTLLFPKTECAQVSVRILAEQ